MGPLRRTAVQGANFCLGDRHRGVRVLLHTGENQACAGAGPELGERGSKFRASPSSFPSDFYVVAFPGVDTFATVSPFSLFPFSFLQFFLSTSASLSPFGLFGISSRTTSQHRITTYLRLPTSNKIHHGCPRASRRTEVRLDHWVSFLQLGGDETKEAHDREGS